MPIKICCAISFGVIIFVALKLPTRNIKDLPSPISFILIRILSRSIHTHISMRRFIHQRAFTPLLICHLPTIVICNALIRCHLMQLFSHFSCISPSRANSACYLLTCIYISSSSQDNGLRCWQTSENLLRNPLLARHKKKLKAFLINFSPFARSRNAVAFCLLTALQNCVINIREFTFISRFAYNALSSRSLSQTRLQALEEVHWTRSMHYAPLEREKASMQRFNCDA